MCIRDRSLRVPSAAVWHETDCTGRTAVHRVVHDGPEQALIEAGMPHVAFEPLSHGRETWCDALRADPHPSEVRMVTLRDVAQAAGVSPATASRALSHPGRVTPVSYTHL